jgi:RNA polymerase sigma-70 factor (ECF subfamily)
MVGMPLEPYGGVDEAELIARSQKQDHEAFGQLVDRYATVVNSLAYRMVGNRADAEDLSQEAFIAAFKALPTFRADAKFSTWLYRIAANKCKDWLRAKRPEQLDAEVDQMADEHVVETRTPERILSQRQVADHLDRAIQRLPPLYREAFILKHVEGLSYEEMEGVLGVSGDTLKMRVYKGRVQLGRELAEFNESQPHMAR